MRALCGKDNSSYSLKGAVYGVYTDKDCTKKVKELTTGDNGTSNTVTLSAGTYYVKIRGHGNYDGAKTMTYKIRKAEQNIATEDQLKTIHSKIAIA